MPELPATTYGGFISQNSPPWLSVGNADAYMQSMGVEVDGLKTKVHDASKAHMPGVGDPAFNDIIGLDRVMPRGPGEADPAYSIRLSQAFETWQHAGNRQTVMAQSINYLGVNLSHPSPALPLCNVVSTSSPVGLYATWDSFMSTDDFSKPPAHRRVSPFNWDWDGKFLWWRTFLVFGVNAGSAIQPAPVIGVGTIGTNPNLSIGFTAPPAIFVGLRQVVRLWKSQNSWYHWFIFNFLPGVGAAGNSLCPLSGTTTGNPDGTWAKNGKILSDGTYGQARVSSARYVDGTALFINANVPTDT